ncbi:hypothetical protein F4802DRAFT_548243 [Xylaria palmicola]|nr:hypothetical protein F4802DRAFT_548243 [Xylaria palmicola]
MPKKKRPVIKPGINSLRSFFIPSIWTIFSMLAVELLICSGTRALMNPSPDHKLLVVALIDQNPMLFQLPVHNGDLAIEEALLDTATSIESFCYLSCPSIVYPLRNCPSRVIYPIPKAHR